MGGRGKKIGGRGPTSKVQLDCRQLNEEMIPLIKRGKCKERKTVGSSLEREREPCCFLLLDSPPLLTPHKTHTKVVEEHACRTCMHDITCLCILFFLCTQYGRQSRSCVPAVAFTSEDLRPATPFFLQPPPFFNSCRIHQTRCVTSC